MTRKAGRVAIVPKGDFVNGTEYKRLDMVKYNVGIYVAIKDNVNIPPTDKENWMFMMEELKSTYNIISSDPDNWEQGTWSTANIGTYDEIKIKNNPAYDDYMVRTIKTIPIPARVPYTIAVFNIVEYDYSIGAFDEFGNFMGNFKNIDKGENPSIINDQRVFSISISIKKRNDNKITVDEVPYVKIKVEPGSVEYPIWTPCPDDYVPIMTGLTDLKKNIQDLYYKPEDQIVISKAAVKFATIQATNKIVIFIQLSKPLIGVEEVSLSGDYNFTIVLQPGEDPWTSLDRISSMNPQIDIIENGLLLTLTTNSVSQYYGRGEIFQVSFNNDLTFLLS